MNIISAMGLVVVLFLVPGIALAGFTDNGNGTVTDTVTGLMWQQCSDGLSGVGCATGTAVAVTWESAIAYCEGLSLGGFPDWRLPNIRELRSIVDPTKAAAPLINTTFFLASVSSYYWSSTSYAPDTALAWNVRFDYGYAGYSNKAVAYYVRCVR